MRKAIATASCCVIGLSCGDVEVERVPVAGTELELRVDADSMNLSPISWLAVAANGDMAFSQSQDGNVRFVDARGADLGTFGRQGQGPGEFQWIGAHGWLADTLFVLDPQSRRATLISPGRSLVRTIPWPTTIEFDHDASTPDPHFFWVLPQAVYGDGSMLTSPMLASGDTTMQWPGGNRPGDPLVRIDRSGAFQRIVAWLPENKCRVSYSFQGGSGVHTIPFCSAPLSNVAADGSLVVVASAGRVSGGSGSYDVTVIRPAGDTAVTRTYAYEPVAIPGALADSARDARSKNEQQPEAQAALRSMSIPRTYPPLSRVLSGRDGTIWLELYTSSGERQWRVLDGSGDIVTEVVIPRRVRVMVAERDTFWGTDTDDDGLQHIVRYRVTR